MRLLTIEESFEDVIQDVKNGESNYDSKTFWVAERDLASDDDRQDFYDVPVKENLIGCQNIKLSKIARKEYRLKISEREYNLKCANKSLSIAEGNITALAISKSDILAIGTSIGTIYIYDLKNDKLLNKILDYDMTGVTKLRIFSSEEVIISVSEDLTVRIWSITSDKPVREFRNHTKAITDIILIGQVGRNFLSSSRDGSINLNDCGTGRIIHKFQRIDNHNDPVNCMVIGSLVSNRKASTLEFETEGKCIYAGYDSGLVQQFDIAGHTETSVRFCNGSGERVISLDIIANYLLVGHSNGLVRIWDISSEFLQFEATLNKNYSIEIMKGLSYNDISKELTFLVYNGPETLLQLKVNLKDSTISNLVHYVGLPELFQVSSIDKNSQHIVIGGKYNLLELYNN